MSLTTAAFLAAYAIVANIAYVLKGLFAAFGQAAQPIMSYNYGAGKKTRVSQAIRWGLGYVSAIMLVGILLLVLRLLYLQKRESLAANADEVLVTVEEVQTELQKMNLPRRLDQRTLEELMRTLRRYNLARPVGRLTGLDSRIEVFPTVLLALPDADLADAAAESSRTREELALYERPDGDASGEEEE